MIINSTEVYPIGYSPLIPYFRGEFFQVGRGRRGRDSIKYFSLKNSVLELPVISTSWRTRVFPYVQPS